MGISDELLNIFIRRFTFVWIVAKVSCSLTHACIDIILQVSRRLCYHFDDMVYIRLHFIVVMLDQLFEGLVLFFLYIVTELVVYIEHVLLRSLV